MSLLESARRHTARILGFTPAAQPRPSVAGCPAWVLCAASSLLMAASLPPLGWPFVGFIAPVGLALLCLGSSPALALRVVFWWGLLHWMVTFHFIRLPHWAGWIGWVALAAYLALYNVAWVAIARRLVQRQRWPLWLAFPLTGVSLEAVRSYLFTGLPFGLLAHNLYLQPFWIQTADLAGELTVSYLMMLSASGLAGLAFLGLGRRAELSAARGRAVVAAEARAEHGLPPVRLPTYLLTALAGVAVMAGYGFSTFHRYRLPDDPADARWVALVQGSQDVEFGLSPQEAQQRLEDSFRDHQRLTLSARQQRPDLLAVFWPESMFPAVDVLPFDPAVYQEISASETSDGSADQAIASRPTVDQLEKARLMLPWQVRETTGTGPPEAYPYSSGVDLIVGMSSLDPVGDRDHNAAVHFDPGGQVRDRYFKVHLVPFGEYLPLGETFPSLYQLAPIPRGLTPGDGPRVFQVEQLRFVPSICYESVIGRLLRRYLLSIADQANADEADGDRPSSDAHQAAGDPGWDALVNLSNDGWFWGSNALDLHLASNVFRAVENRGQHLVACNTGISAHIAPNGEILQQGLKRRSALLLVPVSPRPADWRPWWWTVGPWPWVTTTAIVALAWLASLRQINRRRSM